MGISHAYIDTYYILEVVFEGEEKSHAKNLLYKLGHSGSFKILIPQIVLGEAVSKIFAKYDRKDVLDKALIRLAKIIRDVKINVNTCLVPPVSHGVFKIMQDLANRDGQLGRTDIMIVSHALGSRIQVLFHAGRIPRAILNCRHMKGSSAGMAAERKRCMSRRGFDKIDPDQAVKHV